MLSSTEFTYLALALVLFPTFTREFFLNFCTVTTSAYGFHAFSTFLTSSVCTGGCGICPKLWTSNLLKQAVGTISGCLIHASSASRFINSLSDISGELSPCGKVGVEFFNIFVLLKCFSSISEHLLYL